MFKYGSVTTLFSAHDYHTKGRNTGEIVEINGSTTSCEKTMYDLVLG